MNSSWKVSLAIGAALTVAVAPVAVGQKADQAKAKNVTVARGAFSDSAKYTGSGNATVVKKGSARTVRIAKNFRADPGAVRLRLYLATDASGATHIDLGAMAESGAQNFRLPKSASLTKYRYLVAWCAAVNEPISQAKLIPTGRK